MPSGGGADRVVLGSACGRGGGADRGDRLDLYRYRLGAHAGLARHDLTGNRQTDLVENR